MSPKPPPYIHKHARPKFDCYCRRLYPLCHHHAGRNRHSTTNSVQCTLTSSPVPAPPHVKIAPGVSVGQGAVRLIQHIVTITRLGRDAASNRFASASNIHGFERVVCSTVAPVLNAVTSPMLVKLDNEVCGVWEVGG